MNQFINTRYNLATSCFTWIVCTTVFPLFDWSTNQKIGILVRPQGLFLATSAQKNSCMQTVNEPWECSPKTSSAVCLHQSHRWTEAYKYPQKRTRVHAGVGRLSAHTRMHVHIWSRSRKGHRRLICPSCFLLKDCNWGWQRSECRWPILDYTAVEERTDERGAVQPQRRRGGGVF